jgi:hypothetical protein
MTVDKSPRPYVPVGATWEMPPEPAPRRRPYYLGFLVVPVLRQSGLPPYSR